MRIHYIQNDSLATLGYILEWTNEKNLSLTCTKMYDQETLPDIDSFDMLIILGGRMGAYEEDEFPWLVTEKNYIRAAIDHGKAILGICLGAQLLASALGSKVYPHSHEEMGWWQIELSGSGSSPLFKGVPDIFTAFEHHGDTFDLPEGATRLALSDGCRNQAFSYGERVIGLQFHPEFSESIICDLAQNARPTNSGTFIQQPEQWTNKPALLNGAKTVLFTLLNNIEAEFVKQSSTKVNI